MITIREWDDGTERVREYDHPAWAEVDDPDGCGLCAIHTHQVPLWQGFNDEGPWLAARCVVDECQGAYVLRPRWSESALNDGLREWLGDLWEWASSEGWDMDQWLCPEHSGIPSDDELIAN